MHCYKKEETVGYALYVREADVKKLKEGHKLNSDCYLIFYTLL